MKETPWGLWDPLTPGALVPILSSLTVPWWISGGYALEAFAGRSWREHDDIDASFLRHDQLVVRRHLAAWDVHAADPPGTLRPWPLDEVLPVYVHDIWIRETADGPWRFQLMIDDTEGGSWLFRRNPAIGLPLNEVTWERDGVRYLQPHVQLLFKSRAPRPKDEADFAEVAPLLSAGQRSWLGRMIAADLAEHPWLAELGSPESPRRNPASPGPMTNPTTGTEPTR